MSDRRLKWAVPIIWSVLFLLDGIVSFIFQRWLFQYPFTISPQIFLIGVVLTVYRLPSHRWFIWLGFLIGLFYDSFYFGVIGYYTFLIPAVIIFVGWLSSFLPTSFLFQIVVFILTLIALEIALYVLNSFFGLAGDFSTFVTNNLGPGITFNVGLFVLLYYPFTRLLQQLTV